ncbi:MAG: hypothetical protein AAB502_00650 [Chloroflexota bacterium]
MNPSNGFGFIEKLTVPVPKGSQERKVWSISLSRLVRFGAATNVNGKTAIPADALGAPTRLVKDKDTGEVKFSKAGMPVYRLHPEISGFVRGIRVNLENQMDAYFTYTSETRADALKAQFELAQATAAPIVMREAAAIHEALLAKAQAVAAAAPAAVTPTPEPDPSAVAPTPDPIAVAA